MRVFIDSNIPMYVAGREHPNREPALELLRAVRDGRHQGVTSTEVLQEILYRYYSLGRADLAGEVYDLFVDLCDEVLEVRLVDTDRAKALLEQYQGLTVRDALHAAVMFHHDLGSIATFDRGFDRIDGIERMALDRGP